MSEFVENARSKFLCSQLKLNKMCTQFAIRSRSHSLTLVRVYIIKFGVELIASIGFRIYVVSMILSVILEDLKNWIVVNSLVIIQ